MDLLARTSCYIDVTPTGLRDGGAVFLHRCRPYGAKNLLLKKMPKIRGIRVIRDSDNQHIHFIAR